MEQIKYGYIKSKIDGTEKIFDAKQTISLPKEYSYMNYLPGVINQGDKPICVPCSISSYVNWNLNIKNGEDEKDYKVDLYEIYNSRSDKTDVENGMTIKEALHFLKNKGVSNTFNVFKINGYSMVNSVLALKTALVMNGICIAGLPVYDSSQKNFWVKKGELTGGHAVAIIGYDEDGFIIRNSWGTSYGNKGYVHMKYDDFNKFYEIWTLY